MRRVGLLTVEEHLSHGGFRVWEVGWRRCWVEEAPAPMEIVALEGYTESGDPALLMKKYHLAVEDVEAAVWRVMERKGG